MDHRCGRRGSGRLTLKPTHNLIMHKCTNVPMHISAFMHSCILAFPRAAVAAALIVLAPSVTEAQIYESVGIRAQGRTDGCDDLLVDLASGSATTVAVPS